MPPAPQKPAASPRRGKLTVALGKMAGLPLWYGAVVVAVCLVIKEFYPFSHFPMYSKNSPTTFCLFITDGDEKMLFTVPEFGKLSSVLKKKYNTEIQKYKADGSIKRYDEMTPEQIRVVGEKILQWLVEERRKSGRPPLPGMVRLIHEQFFLGDGKVVRETFKLAEIPGGGPS